MNRMIVAFSVILGLALHPAVMAHSKVKTNIPSVGDSVSAGQSDLKINFSKKVRITSFKMYKLEDQQSPTDESLDLVDNAKIEITSPISRKFTKSFDLSFDALDVGVYVYKWVSVARDGHTQKGSGYFSVID